MRKSLAVALLALPLVAADCGGEDLVRSPTGCTLRVRGAVSEDLVCQVSAFDYGALDPTTTEWAFQVIGARLDARSQVDVGFFLPARPVLGKAYGWTSTSSSVESGNAARVVADPTNPSAPPTTSHEASPPFFTATDGLGAVTVTLSALAASGATSTPGVSAAHGTLDGTLVATDGSGATITIHADF